MRITIIFLISILKLIFSFQSRWNFMNYEKDASPIKIRDVLNDENLYDAK